MNDMRLVDITPIVNGWNDTVKEKLEESKTLMAYWNFSDYHNGVVKEEIANLVSGLADDLMSAPAVDPESLRGHARWVKDENVKIITVDAYGNTFESPAVYCENCNTALSEADFKGRVWNYCPVCGFVMEDATNE